MAVKSIMSAPAVTVGLDDTLTRVRDIFAREHFHHLVVVESGKLVGVISDRDLLRALSPRIDTPAATSSDMATLNRRVHQIMTRKPVTAPPDASVADVIELILEHGVSCVPVVDPSDHPMGIVTWRDILKTMRDKRG